MGSATLCATANSSPNASFSEAVSLSSGTWPTASAPTATTSAATSITTTGATLNGTVNDNGAATTVNFNYGTTVSYGSSATATQSPVASGTGSTSVSAPLTGLTCNTTYHFRVSATNSVNTTNGSDATFTTSACPVPTLSITNSPQTYTGSPIAATVSCLGGGAVSNVLYGGSSTVPTNAGTYAVTANCAASSNYSAVTGASAGNFVINAATQPTTLVVAPTVPTSVTTGGSVNLSFNGGNGTGAVTYSAVALAQSPAAANAVSPRTIGLQCTINGAVLTPTGGTGVCQVTATKAADANYQAQTSAPFNITVTAVPSPAPIPTLSEWAEIMMMLLMILTVGWYGRRLNQR